MGTEKHKHASKREAYAEVMVKNNIFYEITGGKTTFITMLYWHRIVLFSLILIFFKFKNVAFTVLSNTLFILYNDYSDFFNKVSSLFVPLYIHKSICNIICEICKLFPLSKNVMS